MVHYPHFFITYELDTTAHNFSAQQETIEGHESKDILTIPVKAFLPEMGQRIEGDVTMLERLGFSVLFAISIFYALITLYTTTANHYYSSALTTQ